MSAWPENTSRSTESTTTLVRDTKLRAGLWEIFSAADLVFSAAETWPDPATDSSALLHPGNRCSKGHALGCECSHTSSRAVSHPRSRHKEKSHSVWELPLCHLLDTCLSPFPAQEAGWPPPEQPAQGRRSKLE